MKWITSTTIKQWADTRSAQGLLPELILRLIRATSTNTSNIRFPNGDAVHLTGWDGVVESADAIFNISPGISLWECGVNANPLQKANEDYNKRTKDPLKYDKASATFVFVTPRIWDKATEWVQEKKQSKDMIASVKKDWTKQKHKISEIKSIELYVKPEDYAVYYVINGEHTGKVWL